MIALERFTNEQKQLIISLPYRTGLWISRSDDSGGDEAGQKELTALENILHGFSEQVFGSELLQNIMAETVNRKAEWQDWGENLDHFPAQCEQALDILRSYVNEKDVNAYAMRLIEIGEAVALAFREYEESSKLDHAMMFLSYIIMKMKASLHKTPSKSFDQYLSISSSERKALAHLASALGSNYRI